MLGGSRSTWTVKSRSVCTVCIAHRTKNPINIVPCSQNACWCPRKALFFFTWEQSIFTWVWYNTLANKKLYWHQHTKHKVVEPTWREFRLVGIVVNRIVNSDYFMVVTFKVVHVVRLDNQKVDHSRLPKVEANWVQLFGCQSCQVRLSSRQLHELQGQSGC